MTWKLHFIKLCICQDGDREQVGSETESDPDVT